MKKDDDATGSANEALVGRRGIMLVLSSPSGAGKTTIARRLLADDADLNFQCLQPLGNAARGGRGRLPFCHGTGFSNYD